MAETVTVRMSRGDVGTPWGFDIASGDRGEPVITNVRGGSLADRAGLRNGDVLDILESLDNLDALAADRLVATSRNQIELIVHRQPGGASASARAWKPPEFSSSDVSSTINKFQSTTLNDHRASSYTNGNSSNSYSRGPSVGAGGGAGSGFGGGGGIGGGPHDRPIKVNLEHHPEVIVPQGFNKPALPFATDPRVQHLQYNSPLNIYSAQTAAEQYLQQTGGLFGTDPKLANRQAPSYLQSETLRLVQEEDKFGNREVRLRPEPRAAPTLSSHPNPANLPVCFLCGRHILGVLCRAAGHDLHADCFVCATCGAPLRNQGHHVVNDKFYCDVHGRQRQHFGGAPSIPPEIVVKSSPTAAHPVRPQETLKAPYQPDVLHRGPLSISPTRWKTQSPISPANRGVPASATQYGQDFKRDIIHESSSTYAAPPPPPPPSNPPPGESYSRQTFREERRTTSTTEDSARGRLVSAIPAGSGGRIPVCEACKQQIRGAYVLAAGLAWCPEHFICANASCGRRLLDVGFVEEKGKKYCEACFANHIAPRCAKCSRAITADCLNALQKQWHPECFTCAHCAKPFGNSAFYLENGQPYCEQDWNQLFTTKCISCSYPIEAGDRWVEALGSAYHSNCFNCTRCQVNLEGESFYAKNGQPYCKQHA